MSEILKKVMVVLPNGRGGAEMQSIRIASFLPRDKYRIIYVIVGESDSKVSTLLPQSAETRVIKLSHIWQGGTFLLFNCFKRERPFAVLSSHHYLNGRCILAASWAHVPRVIVRGNQGIEEENPVTLIMIRLYYKKAYAIICQTDEMAEEMSSLIRISPERIHSLYNPIDVDLLDKKSSAGNNPYGPGIHFVCVARICPNKGQDVLLQAFKSLLSLHQDAHLHFLGEVNDADDYHSGLLRYVEENAMTSNVHFEGYQVNPYVWIKYSNCLVLPSFVEGLPNVLIEAQYLGVPCVATESVRSISKIIMDNVNGYIVPVGDCQAICTAMSKAIELHDVPFTYKSAEPADFIALFE